MLHYDACPGCGRTALCYNTACTEELCPQCQDDEDQARWAYEQEQAELAIDEEQSAL